MTLSLDRACISENIPIFLKKHLLFFFNISAQLIIKAFKFLCFTTFLGSFIYYISSKCLLKIEFFKIKSFFEKVFLESNIYLDPVKWHIFALLY